MTSTKKILSAKSFLRKTNTKAAHSALAFINQYREWLVTGELAQATTPIIKKLDDNELLPTPALREIQVIVLSHILAKDAAKLEEIHNPKVNKENCWISTIYNSDGEIQCRVKTNGDTEELIKKFDLSSDADRWSDLRLFDSTADCYAEIVHNKLKVKTIIMRDDSISRILKKKKSAVSKINPTSTKFLKFGTKCKEDKAVFSRG